MVRFCTFFEIMDLSVSSRISPVSLGVISERFILGFLNGFLGAPPSFSSLCSVCFALKLSYSSSSEEESSSVSFIPAGATVLGNSPSSNISIYSISTS